jgi:two-component system, NtrC family, response regulator AtoC
MAFEKIIVLDDEMIIRKTLETHLRRKHYSVATASRIAEADALLAKDQFDLIFVDMRLPDGDGMELLERISEMPDAPLVVVITGYGTIESAVECMRKGAFDYVVKPCSMDEIEVIIKKAEAFSQLVKVNRFFSNEQSTATEIIGNSPVMRQLRTMIKKVAATEATVLITGENGTGKELVAGELYKLSPRANQPFIKVNCAAISETLIESEFFGHEKGAFTGAAQRREGRFELANNGTILLDEIGEIPPRLQAKLLRVLQEREFERVGGNRTIKVDVRVLATTNRNLLREVQKGNFREDLYYRLNVFPIEVPALRERGEDIALIAQSFLERFARKHGLKNAPGFSKSAMDLIIRHNWPGNVRELQNTIERAVILCDQDQPIQPYTLGIVKASAGSLATAEQSASSAQALQPQSHSVMDTGAPEGSMPLTPSPLMPISAYVPPIEPPAVIAVKSAEPDEADEISANVPDMEVASVSSGSPAPQTGDAGKVKTLEELEKEQILSVLRKTGWKRAEAADMLAISTRTLRNKINQYRLEGMQIP